MASKGLVLVTGINGFIAARTAEALLQDGYSVRGTARSKSTTSAVAGALAQYKDHLEIFEVKDITVSGAFDEAIKGVTHVAHLASPMNVGGAEPDEIISTAVHGTTAVLEAALKTSSVRAVAMTSSVVAIISQKAEPYTFTEADWNQQSLDIVAQQGKATIPWVVYSASKTAAEKAFWKFREEKKPHFTMTAINPSYVGGPPLVKPTRPEDVNSTVAPFSRALLGEPIAKAAMNKDFQAYVDVRDVARLFVFGFDHPEKADGQRYIATAGSVPQQAIHDILRRAYPERKDIIDAGEPGSGYDPNFCFIGPMKFDNSKAVRDTGKEWIPVEQTVLETGKALEGLF